MCKWVPWAAVFVVGFGSLSWAEPTDDGLYARFETSKGRFFCRLEYTLVPRTVANFVGLAEGTKSFIDYSQAKITRRAFFDGLLFHRVVTNFVIQGGSLTGRGTDDPGYRFKDEFHPSLNHNRAGVLSMANSGTNSNGSQFFITLRPTSNLDNKHSVFGEVVEGLDIVQEIGGVPVDGNSRPITPVYMSSVMIMRIGSGAAAFEASAIQPPLPEPNGIRSELRVQGSNRLLRWQTASNRQYRLAASLDLAHWESAGSFAGSPVIINPYLPQLFLTVFETNLDQ